MKERCSTRPYLMMASSERKQTFRCDDCLAELKMTPDNKDFMVKCDCGGRMRYVPSTTQLIQGTMAAFLKLTQDFDISPDSRAFMITGSRGHQKLESYDDDYSLIEEKLVDSEVSGIADLLTQEDGQMVLSDYKVTGSFKVAKCLGMVTAEEETGEIYKSGAKKGQSKTRKVLKRDESTIDMTEWELQLNKYRIEFERMGFKIDKLKIQCIVRDGNTFIARSRGVFRNVYYFEIKRLPDDYVIEYFAQKRRALLKALETGKHHNVCTGVENWDGVKCASYCEVAEHCPLGKYLKEERQKGADTMPIMGLTEARRLPRMGKIRLGVKAKSANGHEYPKEVDYFILDPAVANPDEKKRLIDIFHQKYGEQPKSIPIMFPLGDIEKIFPQYYKSYGKTTLLKCKGDGTEAITNDPEYIKALDVVSEDEFGKRVKCRGKECPFYKSKQCSESAALSFLMPELPGSGVWQINTGSIHSIINLNSCFDYVRAVAGRFHMIPLKLERRLQPIAHEGKSINHYILHINLDISLADLQKSAQIDPQRIALDIPPIEPDKEDIYLECNTEINVPENRDVVPPEQDWGAGATITEKADIEWQFEDEILGCRTEEQLINVRNRYKPIVEKLTLDAQERVKAVYQKRVDYIKKGGYGSGYRENQEAKEVRTEG